VGNSFNRRTFLSRGVAAGGALALGAGASSLLAGCSTTNGGSTTTTATGGQPGVGTGSPVRGGALTIATTAEIDGFYPATNHWDNNGFLYANTVFDPLMAVAAAP